MLQEGKESLEASEGARRVLQGEVDALRHQLEVFHKQNEDVGGVVLGLVVVE